MMIEQLFPDVIDKKSTLKDCLLEEAKVRNIEIVCANQIISIIPQTLILAPCFLDKLTGLWRYEFGLPYSVGKDFVWGTHMWLPVSDLFSTLLCAYTRLPQDKRDTYINRLSDPSVHRSTLVEMIPGCKIDVTVSVQFEVPELGVGHRTVDWVIQPKTGREVLVDVKHRIIDFISQAEQMGNEPLVPEPDHDPALMFRSAEQKFNPCDPDQQLQGVWIVTFIKQNEQALNEAFTALDSGKIHFAILGDWKPDAHILVQRDSDEQYLREIFRVGASTRFTFSDQR